MLLEYRILMIILYSYHAVSQVYATMEKQQRIMQWTDLMDFLMGELAKAGQCLQLKNTDDWSYMLLLFW